MNRLHHSLPCVVGVGLAAAALTVVAGQVSDPISDLLGQNQRDLAAEGRTFLVEQARRASFFLLGGLHGDNETQALVLDLGQAFQPLGYRFTAVEMSPWAASRLLPSLGSQDEGALWGTDIEEVQPHLLVRELATANPQNEGLQSMAQLVATGYHRAQAPALLALARQAGEVRDITVQTTSLRTLLVRTLEVEAERRDPRTSLAASVNRETFMKELFVANYRQLAKGASKPKVMLVFGQNHMHRGYDRRGVSTLGNFVAELAVAEGVQSFHVALFAAGGMVRSGGLRDADQRKDDPALEWLAALARFQATLFDLRPIRQALRDIPTASLPAREASLLYWADSYDAIICYREVTPAGGPSRSR